MPDSNVYRKHLQHYPFSFFHRLYSPRFLGCYPLFCGILTMAGTKKPVNIFRLKNLGDPSEVFNWRLWLAVITFGLMGAARGVDEGLISGAFNSKDFQRTIHLDSYSEIEQTNIKANVSAMVQIGSVGGALLYVHFPLFCSMSTCLYGGTDDSATPTVRS